MIKIAQALFTRKKTTRVRAGTNTSQCTLFTILIVFLIVFEWIFFRERGRQFSTSFKPLSEEEFSEDRFVG